MVPTFAAKVDWSREQFDHIGKIIINNSIRAALMAALQYHIQRHVPNHFLPSASAKYNYFRRSPSYIARKMKAQLVYSRLVGKFIRAPKPPADLVWSGDIMHKLRRDAASVRGNEDAFKITVTPTKSKISIRFMLAHFIRVHHVTELQAITQDEVSRLHQVASITLSNILNREAAGRTSTGRRSRAKAKGNP